MANNVDYYLNNYLDILVQDTLSLKSLVPNYLDVELDLYFNKIDNLVTKIKNQDTITNKALLEFQSNYNELKNNLDSKLAYITDTAETFNKLNKTFDTTEFKQISTFTKLGTTGIEGSSEFFLKRDKTNFNFTKELIDDSTIIFYNSNSNFHNSITFEHIDKDYIASILFEFLLIDGTTKVYIKDQSEIVNNTITLETDPMITLSLKVNVTYVDDNITNKLDILSDITSYSSLYTYTKEGYIDFNEVVFDSPHILSFNQTISLPSNTYVNYHVKLNNITFTIPVGNSIVCKRADKVSEKEIKSIVGIYKDNFFTSTINEVSEILDKENTYVVYYPKVASNVVINNIIKVINDYSFRFLSYNETVSFKLSAELFSFDMYSTPKIKNIIGYAK